MKKNKESIGYISGEPEGLGRHEPEELREEEERLAGGKRQMETRRKKGAPGKKSVVTGWKEEIALKDAAEEDLISGELNPEQTLELKQAMKHGFADIAQNPKEDIEPELGKSLEDLRKRTEEKERRERSTRRKK